MRPPVESLDPGLLARNNIARIEVKILVDLLVDENGSHDRLALKSLKQRRTHAQRRGSGEDKHMVVPWKRRPHTSRCEVLSTTEKIGRKIECQSLVSRRELVGIECGLGVSPQPEHPVESSSTQVALIAPSLKANGAAHRWNHVRGTGFYFDQLSGDGSSKQRRKSQP